MKSTLNVEARKNECQNVSSQIDYRKSIISFSNEDMIFRHNLVIYSI